MAEDTATAILGDSSYLKDPPNIDDLSSYATEIIDTCDKTLLGQTNSAEYRNSHLHDGLLETLLVAEKRCRLACDGVSNSRICQYIIVNLLKSGDFEKTCKFILMLCKKRNQLKRCVIDIVTMCMDWLYNGSVTLDDQKYHLIEVLSNITAGKMFLEAERAKLLMELSQMKEKDGDIKAAAEILQDVPIETFGSVCKKYKGEYILEQMRLLLLKGDRIRFYSCSKKINEKLLLGDEFRDMKFVYYKYMIQYYIHEEDYFAVSKCYKKILDTPELQEQFLLDNISHYVLFLIVSNHSTERDELLKSVKTDCKGICKIPLLVNLLDQFLSRNLIFLPFDTELGKYIQDHQAFQNSPFPNGDERLKTLRLRAVQHNIQIIQQNYTNITIDRLVQLSGSSVEDILPQIFEMVNLGLITAKIDRLQNTIDFNPLKDPQQLLNDWSECVQKVVLLVDDTCRLIEKDKMLQEAREKRVKLELMLDS